MSQNELEELAKAAFYITDMARGCIGAFKIEEDGWGAGDAPRCAQEIRHCLAYLTDEGWTRDDKLAYLAPYTANIKRAVYWKKFEGEKRWITITFADRFGILCEFTSHAKKPW
jgi:hypothetical protein